jgi:hypothetical protein
MIQAHHSSREILATSILSLTVDKIIAENIRDRIRIAQCGGIAFHDSKSLPMVEDTTLLIENKSVPTDVTICSHKKSCIVNARFLRPLALEKNIM